MACSFGWESDAIIFAKQIPSPSEFTYIGEFTVGYPSSLPGAGITYKTKMGKQKIIDFYLEQLPSDGWTIISTDINNDFKTVPSIVNANKGKWRCSVIVEDFETDIRQITIEIRTSE